MRRYGRGLLMAALLAGTVFSGCVPSEPEKSDAASASGTGTGTNTTRSVSDGPRGVGTAAGTGSGTNTTRSVSDGLRGTATADGAATATATATEEEGRYWDGSKGAEPAPVDDPARVTEGQMRVNVAEGKMVALPLAHTTVEAETTGFLSRVYVTQYFTNPFDHPIEAIYVFPLPQQAAVDDMEMLIGDRLVRGIMKKREEAKRIYEDAKAQGKTASLLEQERTNIFTQSVANILPGDRIRVRIRYVEDLKHEDGWFEFVFPMVVGPRYIPGEPAGRQGGDKAAEPANGQAGQKGGGWSPDTAQVPDASRITPPVLKPGERTGHDIDVTLTINQGVELGVIISPSHDIDVVRLEKGRANVTLKPYDTLPNKDLTVRFRTLGIALETAPLFHREGSDGFFMLVMQPEDEPEPVVVSARELVFVVDCSGSMSGEPISKVKDAMRKVLKAMRPDDYFQIVTFSTRAEYFRPKPVQNTTENLKAGLEFVDRTHASGGTRMIEGIRASLDYPADPNRIRIVAFMTDGFIGNEAMILSAVKEKLGSSRLFSFGIGSSVNRYLLDGLARMGRGYVTYVRQDESPDAAVERFSRRLATPTLTDIQVEVKGAVTVEDVTPQPVPDLYAGQPLVVHGRYTGAGAAIIIVTGRRGQADFRQEIPVVFPEEENANGSLATLWARTRIEEQSDRMHAEGETAELAGRITDLAIAYRIMSKYTSFVAVEETVRVKDGKAETIQVAVPMPEGTSYEGVFGEGDVHGLRSRSALSSGTVVGLIGSGGGGGGAGGFGSGGIGGPGGGMGSLFVASGEFEELDKKRIVGPSRKDSFSEPRSRVKMDFGKPAGGKVEMQLVMKHFHARAAALKMCYERALKEDPKLGGMLVLEVTIGTDGKTGVKVLEDKVKSKKLSDCVLEKMERWSMPAPEGKPVTVKVTFEFFVE